MAGDFQKLMSVITAVNEEHGSRTLCNAVLNKHGWTALHAACYFARLDVVKYLVETLRVDTNVQSNSGWHSLTFTVMGSNLR